MHMNQHLRGKCRKKMGQEFEEAFGNFLDRHEYDEAESALFGMVRTSFLAGWLAAGGAPPQSERIFQLMNLQREK